MKLINSRFIGCTYCFPRSAARFQLTSSRWWTCEKNNDDESKRGEGVEKGKAVTTRILQSQGRRGRSRQGWQFSGASHPLPVSTKYTVHRACNVPLSVDPTGLLHARTYKYTDTRTRNTRSPWAGVCPMICSSAIMPLAGTLLSPSLAPLSLLPS